MVGKIKRGARHLIFFLSEEKLRIINNVFLLMTVKPRQRNRENFHAKSVEKTKQIGLSNTNKHNMLFTLKNAYAIFNVSFFFIFACSHNTSYNNDQILLVSRKCKLIRLHFCL